MLSAPEILKKVHYRQNRRFDLIFPDTILMTQAMQKSYFNDLPIFHASQKIAETILIVKKDDAYHIAIVASVEATFLRTHMSFDEEIWLVNSNGNSLIRNDEPSTDPFSFHEICKGFIYAHLFVGRATPVERVPNALIYLDMWLQASKEEKKDRQDYLMLRGWNRPFLDRFDRLIKKLERQEKDYVKQQRMYREEIAQITEVLIIYQFNEYEIEHICPAQVGYINTAFLADLKDPAYIQAVPDKKVGYLCGRTIKTSSQ